jgi:predicted enzyme related to lactoylglutathione lyase
MSSPILELRVALTAADYERLFNFYTQAFGLEPSEIWTNEDTRGVLFDMGRATLEILDEPAAASVDQIEAGSRVSGQIRFALEVPDLDAALKRALAHGAKQVHEPITTPWNHYNVRLQAPDGLQITLFQVPQDA